MHPDPAWFLAAAGASTLLHLRAHYAGPRWQVYFFKPLTIGVLLLLALLPVPGAGREYRAWIVAGLVASLLGDVFLMLPRDRFVAGLASFLVAHIAYAFAFTTGIRAGAGLGVIPLLLAVAIPFVVLLWPRLGRTRLPVVLYVGAILGMVWRAWARRIEFSTIGTLLAAVGAFLFLFSDGVLALNRFHRPVRGAQVIIMVTYEAAQCCIALSARTP